MKKTILKLSLASALLALASCATKQPATPVYNWDGTVITHQAGKCG